jgi:hypothetical protein
MYKEIDPAEKLPEKSWRDPQYKTNQHNTSNPVFVMTDNGISVAYYDYVDNQWKDNNRDNWEHVKYWLEKVITSN